MAHPKNTDYIDELNKEMAELDGSGDSDSSSDSKSSEDFAKLLGESFGAKNKKLRVGDKIKGEILVLGREEVYVSTGTQVDGQISKRDLLDEDGSCPYKVGDQIELYVTLVRKDEVRLSRNATDKNLAKDIEEAYSMKMPVTGRVVEVCKGGVRVNIKGKIAFCPIGQLDFQHTETGEEYVGKSLDFRITKFEEGGRNIVVSRKRLLEEQRDVGSTAFLEENKDGDVVTGKVTRLEKFGAFVELAPGIDGLVHISEIAWSRIGDPSEVLVPGQEVSVKLLKREIVNGRQKISLSIKQATEREMPKPSGEPSRIGAKSGAAAEKAAQNDPWTKFTKGLVLTGKVNRKEPYGLFIQLEPGISGLLHKSQTEENREFQFEKIRIGDDISVQVSEVKRAERRISLTLPGGSDHDDWKSHVSQPQASLGTFGGALGDQLKAALSKKK